MGFQTKSGCQLVLDSSRGDGGGGGEGGRGRELGHGVLRLKEPSGGGDVTSLLEDLCRLSPQKSEFWSGLRSEGRVHVWIKCVVTGQ